MELFTDNRQDIIDISNELKIEIEKAVKESLLFEKENLDYEISLSLVDNEEIKILNRDYRGIDRETDVLSFPVDDEMQFDSNIILGDIVISVEKALEQSKEYNHSFLREMVYLTVHSMFHLMGYDHMEDEEKIMMRNREDIVLEKLGIAR